MCSIEEPDKRACERVTCMAETELKAIKNEISNETNRVSPRYLKEKITGLINCVNILNDFIERIQENE